MLHVIPSVSARHGGPSKAVWRFAEAAYREGVSVSIATTDDDGEEARHEIEKFQGTIEVFSFRRTTASYKISVDLARWLFKRIRDFQVVHIHALFSFSSTFAALTARHKLVPYIVRPLGVLNRWGLENRRVVAKQVSLAIIETKIVRGAAAMHYTTGRERIEAIESLPELLKLRSAVIPVPLPLMDGADKRAASVDLPNQRPPTDYFFNLYPNLKGKKIILFLSRLDAKKGIDLLLQAFAVLVVTLPDARLMIAGDGDPGFVARQHEVSNSLGIEQFITWTGWLDAAAVSAALAAATVFVLPSYSENFGIVVAEAMAAGTPAVISEGVALADELKQSDAAVVVPPDVRSLSDAIGDLLGDPVRRSKVGTEGKRFAEERFSMERIGKCLKELYRSVSRSDDQ